MSDTQITVTVEEDKVLKLVVDNLADRLYTDAFYNNIHTEIRGMVSQEVKRLVNASIGSVVRSHMDKLLSGKLEYTDAYDRKVEVSIAKLVDKFFTEEQDFGNYQRPHRITLARKVVEDNLTRFIETEGKAVAAETFKTIQGDVADKVASAIAELLTTKVGL